MTDFSRLIGYMGSRFGSDTDFQTIKSHIPNWNRLRPDSQKTIEKDWSAFQTAKDPSKVKKLISSVKKWLGDLF